MNRPAGGRQYSTFRHHSRVKKQSISPAPLDLPWTINVHMHCKIVLLDNDLAEHALPDEYNKVRTTLFNENNKCT